MSASSKELNRPLIHKLIRLSSFQSSFTYSNPLIKPICIISYIMRSSPDYTKAYIQLYLSLHNVVLSSKLNDIIKFNHALLIHTIWLPRDVIVLFKLRMNSNVAWYFEDQNQVTFNLICAFLIQRVNYRVIRIKLKPCYT